MNLITKLIRFGSHTIQTTIEANTYKRLKQYQNLTEPSITYKGSFTADGSKAYQQKYTHSTFKPLITDSQMLVSSVGVGTYKGTFDEIDDLPMFNGIIDSIENGVNVIDTCRNFRAGASQKVVGKVLHYLFQNKNYQREELFIASKAGYVRPQTFPKNIDPNQIVNDNCIHPQFLSSQLDRSLKNMSLSTLDVYYLNNFYECQNHLQTSEIENKICKAFEFLQKSRQNKKIKNYGLSSWKSFRCQPDQKQYCNLLKIKQIAEKVGGKNNGFKFVQIPINIAMPQAFAEKYHQDKSFLDFCEDSKINVISNSPLMNGTLINVPLPSSHLKCQNNGAKHLQLIRSIPSKALISTLIGHKKNRHVIKNMEVNHVQALNEGQWLDVFVPKSEANPVIN